jgi:hypothetical protein
VQIRTWLDNQSQPGATVPLPDDIFRATLRLFEANAAIAGEKLIVDETGIPVVQIDQKLHSRWVEIEWRAEDRGVTPNKDLPVGDERLREYELRQMQRKLELMERQRDAVRTRLTGLELPDLEIAEVRQSVRALEVSVAHNNRRNCREKCGFSEKVP